MKKIASELKKIANELGRTAMNEQEATDIMEDLAGSRDNAFRLMRIWESAEQDASGNRFRRFTFGKPPDVTERFVKKAFNAGYSDKAILHYVVNIQGRTMPDGWKKLKFATSKSAKK